VVDEVDHPGEAVVDRGVDLEAAGIPAAAVTACAREDERQTFTFDLRPPAAPAPGTVQVRAVARVGAGRYQTGVVTVDYPHIRPRSYLRPAVATIHVAPLVLPSLARIGYVRGAADRVPEALQGVGLPVTLLDPATLDRGDLRRFDVIVVGPRAYETDSALVEANDEDRGEEEVEGNAPCQKKNIVLSAIVPDALGIIAQRPADPGEERPLRH